jgi:hypothetical protein
LSCGRVTIDAVWIGNWIYWHRSKPQSRYDWRSVGQPVLAPSLIWGPKTRFLLLSVMGLLMWGVLSDERAGLSFTIAAGPRHRINLGSESAGLVTIFYCLRFETSPNLEDQVPVFISPRIQIVKSELLYDWRFTANQFVLSSSPPETHDQSFFSTELLR